MSEAPDIPIDQLLLAASRGDRDAASQLLPKVYDELRRLARAKIRGERKGISIQPTALVHEAYLRVVGQGDPQFDGRGHFFAAAAEAMRRILVDQARRRAAAKRGGDREREDTDVDVEVDPPSDRILDVDMALRKLEATSPRKGQVVSLRYFGGLTTEETALAMELSVGTVEREWRLARAYLKRELDGDIA